MTQPKFAETTLRVSAIVSDMKAMPGALMPILHRVQDELGHIPEAAVAVIADGLQVTRAEVHGVISFYHDFRTEPAGRRVVQICRAEACQANGCRSLEAHAKESLGIGYHETTANGEVTLEPVYCLGNCATGPAIRIGDAIHGRVTLARFDALLQTGSRPLTTTEAGHDD